MTQRVVVGASLLVFALLAVMVHLLVGMHDKASPVALASPPKVTIDFAGADLQGDVAVAELQRWDAASGLGLVKLTADLRPDRAGKIVVSLNDHTALPKTVVWYDDEPAARVAGPETLAHTVPSGSYLATGDPTALEGFVAQLESHGAEVTRDDVSVWIGLQGLYRMKSLFIAFVTGCVLLGILVLYWLAAKTHSRALRVLGGTSVARIQIQDVGRLMLLVAGTWLGVATAASVVVGSWRGWSYVPLFVAYLGTLGGLMVMVMVVVALVMSRVSIPSPELIARRQPGTVGVRRAATVAKGVAFLLVVATIGPAWSALAQANSTAEQLSRWERLADQVNMSFPLVSEEDFQRMMPAFGELVAEAEDDGAVALSHVVRDSPHDEGRVSESLGGQWDGYALVNQQWIDLVLTETEKTRLSAVPFAQIPNRFVDDFSPQLSVWTRSKEAVDALLSDFEFVTPVGGPFPLIDSAGELAYLDDVLVIKVPGVWTTFNDSFLISIASGASLLFTGLEPIQALLDDHGLGNEIRVERAAEAGILRAQFAEYEAWLTGMSLAGLLVALIVAAGISAYLTALLQARNDFVRRLAGHAWLGVLRKRVALDVVLGVTLGAAVAALQPDGQVVPALLAAGIIVSVSPTAHIAAARLGFADVTARRV